MMSAPVITAPSLFTLAVIPSWETMFSGRVIVSWSGLREGYTLTVQESNFFSITLMGSPEMPKFKIELRSKTRMKPGIFFMNPTLSPYFFVVARRSNGYVNVREHPHSFSEIFVLAGYVRSAINLDGRRLRLQNHYVTFNGWNFHDVTFVAPEKEVKHEFFFFFFFTSRTVFEIIWPEPIDLRDLSHDVNVSSAGSRKFS